MARDEIEHDLDTALVALVDKIHEVGVGSEAWVHLIIVDHIVTAIYPTGNEKRVEPYDSNSEFLDVVELRDLSGDVTDSVAVRVLERRRIDLINYGVVKPGRTFFPGLCGLRLGCQVVRGCEKEKNRRST